MLKQISLFARAGFAWVVAWNVATAQTWEDLSANLPVPLAEQQVNGIVSDGSRLYLLGRRGVLMSADNGSSFTVLTQVAGGGPGLDQLVDLALSAIKFVNGEVWIAGSGVTDTPGLVTARLYRLTPGQSVWQPSSTGFPTQLGNADDIAYDPASGQYFITHSTGQVSVSTDNGHSWEQRNNGLVGIGSPASVLAIDGVFLTSRPLGDVLRSTNQGTNWQLTLNATQDGVRPMVAHQGRALLWRGLAVDFSDDTGLTWKRVASALPGVLSSANTLSSDGINLYAVTGGGLHPDTFAYSASGGLTWHVLTREGVPAVSADGKFYASGKIIRQGNHLFVHGVRRNNSFQFESAQLFRLDVSSFNFLNPFQIVLQPQGKGLLVGQSHLLEVYAGGPDLTYQWQKNGADLGGETNRTLLLPAVELGDTGDYRVLVRSGGGEPIPSAVAAVTVFERADGRWDPIFDQTDIDVGGRVHLLTNGQAIVVRTDTTSQRIYRIGADGGRLQNSATTTSAGGRSLSLIDQDGRIVVGAKPQSNTTALWRYHAETFAFQSSLFFPPNTSANRIWDMIEVPGRGYAVVGGFSTVGATALKDFALIGYDNVPVATYPNGAGPDFNTGAESVTVDQDGNIYVAGSFTAWSGVSAPLRVVRFDPEGNVTAITAGLGGLPVGTYGRFVHALKDGRLLLGVGTASVLTLHAVNPDGSRDATFNVAGHTVSNLRRVTQQADGKILVVGGFTSYGGVAAAGYVRLNTDGTVDESFYTATGFSAGTINDVTYDPRGYIYLSTANTGGSATATFQGQGPVGRGPVRIFAAPAEAGPGGFAAWKLQFNFPPGLDGPDDDASGDGTKNIVTYALGGNPLANNADRLPVNVEISHNGDIYPGLTFTRNRDAVGVTIDVSAATDANFAVPAGFVETVEDLGGGVDRVTLRGTTPLPQIITFFFQVKVTGD